MLQDIYKLWRSLRLLEDSLLLNRLTRSSIVRLIKVEVGDMPKERVQRTLAQLKNMIDNRTAVDTDINMTEYNSPGPIENNVYIPTHGGIGNVESSEIGGNPDVKSILDLDYFKDKLFSALGIPKQYMGDTNDSTGFNGGTSLTLISSRYAKKIRKFQNVLIEMITDLMNIILISRGFDSAVNRFTIRMQPPATQEEKDRRDNISACLSQTRDTMDLLVDIDNPVQKLRILKALLGSGYINSEVLNIIQEEIDRHEKEAEQGEDEEDLGATDDFGDEGGSFGGGGDFDLNIDVGGGESSSSGGEETISTETSETPSESSGELPSMEGTGLDFTDSNADFS